MISFLSENEESDIIFYDKLFIGKKNMDINNKEYSIFNDLSPKMFTFLPKYIYNWEKEY